MKQFLFAVTSLLILSSATYGQSKWWVSSDSVNIFTRNTGGVMIGGVEPFGKLTVGGDRLGFNLALVGDYNNLTKNYLKIGVLGRASNGLDGHTLFDLYHSNGTLKKAGFNFRINEKSAFFINGEGNIGIGTEKPQAGLDINSGPDWGGFKKGLRLSANNAISIESGEMKYGMVGSENALHFFATNGGEKVNPFGSAFAKLMSLQPKKVVIEGDLEVKGKIIYEGGQITNGGSTTGGSNTGGSSTGTGTSDDGGVKGGGFGEEEDPSEIWGWGTNGYISKFTSLWQIRNSSLYENASGYIGLGTTSPQTKFMVSSGQLMVWGGSTLPGVLTLKPSGAGHWWNISNANNGKLMIASGDMRSANDSASWVNSAITILSQNWVGIKNTAPEAPLHVNGTMMLSTTNSSSKWEVFGTENAFAIKDYDMNQYRLWINNSNGNIGIGTTNPDTFKLAVNGTVKAKAFVATANGWADFVFADDYKLMPLNQLEKHVKTHKHLPGIPTEKDVMTNGVNVGDVQVKLLQKVEELTLYLIEQNKNIEAQQMDIEQLKEENKNLKAKMKNQ